MAYSWENKKREQNILRWTQSIVIPGHNENQSKADLQEELRDVHKHLHVHRLQHMAVHKVASYAERTYKQIILS